MRYILVILILIHGLIHLTGFVKAFGFAEMPQLSSPVSRPAGIAWLLAAILLLITAGLMIMKTAWAWPAIAAAVLSQIMIVSMWHDARFGTLANGILIVAALLAIGSSRFEHRFWQEVKTERMRTTAQIPEILTEGDLQRLPDPVQRYLRYVGAVNKPKVVAAKIVFEGRMRGRGKDWFPFRSVQYNFFDHPKRLFFMKGRMFGIEVPGFHAYREGRASMDIRLFGLFPVVNIKGPVLDTTETVTLFNDICLAAPAALVDDRIKWVAIDDNTAQATYTVNGISISATLYFNASGQLINFISNDRTEVNEMLRIPFSTPVHQYSQVNGFNLATDGDAVWHYADGDFVYGKFYLQEVVYNP